MARKVVLTCGIWCVGPQAKLPEKRTASKRWLAPNKDWEECVWPQHEELHQESFKLNWKGKGDASRELKTDEALHTRETDQTFKWGSIITSILLL